MCTKLNKSQAQIHCYKYLHTKKIEWKILASFRGCTTIYHVCVFTAQTALSSVHWFCTLREQTKSVHITMKKSQKLIGNICWWRKDKKQSSRNNKWPKVSVPFFQSPKWLLIFSFVCHYWSFIKIFSMATTITRKLQFWSF